MQLGSRESVVRYSTFGKSAIGKSASAGNLVIGRSISVHVAIRQLASPQLALRQFGCWQVRDWQLVSRQMALRHLASRRIHCPTVFRLPDKDISTARQPLPLPDGSFHYSKMVSGCWLAGWLLPWSCWRLHYGCRLPICCIYAVFAAYPAWLAGAAKIQRTWSGEGKVSHLGPRIHLTTACWNPRLQAL